MKTTRRSFLKYLSGLAISVVAIPSFLKSKKAEPENIEKLSASDFPEDTDNWYLVILAVLIQMEK